MSCGTNFYELKNAAQADARYEYRTSLLIDRPSYSSEVESRYVTSLVTSKCSIDIKMLSTESL